MRRESTAAARRVLHASALALGLALSPTDSFLDGLDAYREGRFQQAYDAWRAAEADSKGRDTPRLLFDQALAALQLRSPVDAEVAAERAVAAGGADYVALRDFVAGNAAYLRSRQAAAIADRPEAEPFLFDQAIEEVERARDCWLHAAKARDDWPAAVRNIERALIELRRLREARAEAEKNKKKEPDPPPEEPPPEDEPDDEPQDSNEPPPAPEPPQLGPDELARLLALLDAKEKEKRQLRMSVRRVRAKDVERDW